MKIGLSNLDYRISISLVVMLLLFLGACSSSDNSSNSSVDISAPTQPTNLVASNISLTSVDLVWSESTDNIGVAGYSIYKDNNALSFTPSNTATIDGLNENTSYAFKIKARDDAGNESMFSNILNVTTHKVVASLEVASGDLESYIGNIIDKAPGKSGDNYSLPLTSQLDVWNITVSAILEENLTKAVENASGLGYQITEFTDTTLSQNQIFYILERKESQSNYWGTFVFSKTPKKDKLVLMAPHSQYDTNTGKQAVYCFKNNVAKALLINGTHRCNNSEESSCSGTTNACGSSTAYRISDVAHNVTSAFQKTTEILYENVSNSVFVQLHGFSKGANDPYVIMSNGTRETPSLDYAAKLRDALIDEDNSLTFKLAHIDTDWTRLIGLTNTQGRLINQSTDFCSTSATSSTGRFIHIEQELNKLRKDTAGWLKMSNALHIVF